MSIKRAGSFSRPFIYERVVSVSNEELVVLIQTGDRDRLVELWNQVRRMAYKQAARWAGQGGTTVEDLTQAGFIAMLRAVDTYEPEKARFSTYLFQLLRAEFAAATGWSTKAARLDPLQNAVSLDAPMGGEEDAALADFLMDPTAEAEIMAVDDRDRLDRLHAELETALSSLADEEQRTIRARYYQGKTLTAIAAAEGVSKTAVSRREQNALRRLRHPSRSNRLKAYL